MLWNKKFRKNTFLKKNNVSFEKINQKSKPLAPIKAASNAF